MNKFIVELIGTFFLVLTVGCCVVNPTDGVIAPLAIGSVLAVMIFAGGHISGGHYNPAVTVAVAIRGRLPGNEVPAYIFAQLAGSVIAAGAVYYLKGPNQAPVLTDPLYRMGQIALAEFIFTFALCYVVLNVATAKATAGNSFYGLAIGFTVMAGAFAVGPVSGGVFNPAVATGGLYMGILPAGDYLGYIAAQLAAASFAAFVFKVLHPDEV